MLILTISLINVCSFVTCIEERNTDTLILVHAIFRHGDRTPDIARYPTDPYKDEDYLPFGSGELINQGKQRAYDLGGHLRAKYDQFLGDYYLPSRLQARSSAYDRAQMSLQLVLAALFPPKKEQIWNGYLNWQPIPYIFDPPERDKLLVPRSACPNFARYLNEELKAVRIQELLGQYVDVLEYISQNTGANVTNFALVSPLYFTLKTEEEWGFVLPPWTSKIYPDTVEYFTTVNYLVHTGSNKLKQILSGALLQKIVNDTLAKINNQSDTRLFLYSGHEFNLAWLLNTLNVFQPHVPPYSAHILIEVHKINGQYGVKIFYDNYQSIQSGALTMSGCEEFCPLGQFIALVQDYFPDEDVCG